MDFQLSQESHGKAVNRSITTELKIDTFDVSLATINLESDPVSISAIAC